jgi:hypothetical protein
MFGLFFDLGNGAKYSSETPAHFQWTKWHYIPEDKTLFNLFLNFREYNVDSHCHFHEFRLRYATFPKSVQYDFVVHHGDRLKLNISAERSLNLPQDIHYLD